jgi:signal transduction histidine kinase
MAHGIPDSYQRIKSSNLSSRPSQPGKELGLGLSLSYDIVKAHGGELKVERVGDSGLPAGEAGTEFVVKLPVLA